MLEPLVKSRPLIGESVVDRDNQQETVKDTELAWLAGFLDSDGSIQMTIPRSSRAKNRRVVNLWVDFSNGDPAIIDKALSILDKLDVGCHTAQKHVKPIYKQDGSYYLPNRKICLSLRIGKMANIEKLLRAVSPYLAGQKKALSNILIRFCESRAGKGRKTYDEQDILIVEEFFRQSDGRFAARNLEYLDGFLNDCTLSAA